MKTLYESIKSNIGIGNEAIIKSWWSKCNLSDIPIKIIPNGKGYGVVMDDFSSQSWQWTFNFDKDSYSKMPKSITGIFRKQYLTRDSEGVIVPCKLNFCDIKDIDLSNFDYTNSTVNVLNTHFIFKLCGGKLTGFPKSDKILNATFSMCNFSEITFKNDKIAIGGYDSDSICLDKFKNTELNSLFLTKYDLVPDDILFSKPAINVPYKMEGRKYYLRDYAVYIIDKFVSAGNKAEKMYFCGMGSNDFGFLKKETGKIVLDNNKRWRIVKIK